jgi:predicted kinase
VTRVLSVPRDALVVLVGAAGSGKSTLAARHFAPDEILSSDAYRALLAGDPADQSVTAEAFAALHAELDRRLAAGLLTVVDATSVQGWARRELLDAAKRYGRPAVAIVLALPLEVSLARNAQRPDRRVPASVVRRHDRQLRTALPRLSEEGFEEVVVLASADEVDALEIRTQRNVPKERHPTL